MEKRTRYQEKAIRNYYQNREEIALQRLQELVTELYLAEGKAREKHWKHIVTHLEALDVKPAQIENLRSKDNPALIASFLNSLMKKK